MLAATTDGSQPPSPMAANAMPGAIPNLYGGPQFPQVMNNFQPPALTPESTFHAPSAQRDENADNNEYGYEGNESPETTVPHKLKKKAHKKHHHHHKHHHAFDDNMPITFDAGEGIKL